MSVGLGNISFNLGDGVFASLRNHAGSMELGAWFSCRGSWHFGDFEFGRNGRCQAFIADNTSIGVLIMMENRKEGGESVRFLARSYNVSPNTISRVR
jgi:hypothetical protein